MYSRILKQYLKNEQAIYKKHIFIMKNPILESKNEIIKWVASLDDLESIQELLDMKDRNGKDSKVSESEAEYAVKDDFDERFARGMTSAESRKRTKVFIENLPWKK